MTLKRRIQEAVLCGESADIKRLLITPMMISLVKLVDQYYSRTSAEVAEELNISVQNALARLKKLHKAGYLTKEKGFAESGGPEYKFSRRNIK